MRSLNGLWIKRAWGISLALFGLGISCLGQITGSLRGSVQDATGGGVPRASVTLTNLETKTVRTQPVNSAGEFTFELLLTGSYEVKAQAPGFSAAQTQAQVRTGESTAVVLRLEVGTVTTAVEVTGAVALIDTDNAQLQHAIEGQSVQEIPVGRSANNFALTVPGVAPVTQNNPYLGNGSFNSNGGRGRGNNIMVDGITATDVSVTGTGGALGPLNFSSIKFEELAAADRARRMVLCRNQHLPHRVPAESLRGLHTRRPGGRQRGARHRQ